MLADQLCKAGTVLAYSDEGIAAASTTCGAADTLTFIHNASREGDLRIRAIKLACLRESGVENSQWMKLTEARARRATKKATMRLE